MVVRGWGGSVAAAAGVAAAVGAAQLGLGYGMEIISWRPGADGLSSQAWRSSLAWATWIAATSTIVGAIVADRLAPRPVSEQLDGEPSDDGQDRLAVGLWRLVLATAAAIGGTATVALTAVPARLAEPVETSSPQTVAAGYAVLGVLLGLVIAVGVLASRAVAANLIATAGWLWLLAVVAVVDGVLAGQDWERVPLAFWLFTDAEPDARWAISTGGESWFGNIFLPDAGLAAGAALVIGALAALPAVRRGDHPVGVVVSGAAGPVVVAAAYLLAQPELVGAGATDEAADVSRHLVAPYLVLAGLIGSLLISAVRPRANPRRRDQPKEAKDGDGEGEADHAPETAPVPAPRGEADLARTP